MLGDVCRDSQVHGLPPHQPSRSMPLSSARSVSSLHRVDSTEHDVVVSAGGRPHPVLRWIWAQGTVLRIGVTRAHFEPDGSLILEIGVVPDGEWDREQWTDALDDLYRNAGHPGRVEANRLHYSLQIGDYPPLRGDDYGRRRPASGGPWMEHLGGGGGNRYGYVDELQIWAVAETDNVRASCEWLDFGIAPVVHELTAAELVARVASHPSR
jgi:hypothetical protein